MATTKPSRAMLNIGEIGDYAEAEVVYSARFSVVTDTVFQVTSLTLPPGDWDLSGCVGTETTSGAALQEMHCDIGLNPAAIETAPAKGSTFAVHIQFLANFNNIVPVGPRRFLLAEQTTIYLRGLVKFPSGACTAYGFLRARRWA